MKKIYRFLVFLLVLALVIPTYVHNAVKAETEAISMDIITRDKTPQGDNVYSYLTGKDIRAQADILVSGATVNYKLGKLIINVPKKTSSGLAIDKPQFVSSQEAISSIESETDTHYIMTYTFRVIEGGTLGTYDFPLKFKNEVTPNGDTITPTWEMQDADGNVVKKVQRTFTAIASSDWAPSKHIPDDWNEVTWDDQHYSGNAREDGYQELRKYFTDQKAPTITDQNGKGYRVRYVLDAMFDPKNGIDTQYGIYNAETITFVDTIPEGATFESIELDSQAVRDGNKILSKEYDESTRQVKLKVQVGRLGNLTHQSNRRGIRAHIRLSYRNRPMDEVQRNKLHLVINEDTTAPVTTKEAKWSIKFRAFEQKSTTPSGHGRTGRTYLDTYREWTYVYNPDAEKISSRNSTSTVENAILYSTSLNNSNNGTWHGLSGGIRSIIDKVTFKQLDPRLYFKQFRISSYGIQASLKDKINNSANTLYGVKEDGTEELISSNLKVSDPNDFNKEGTFVDINDTNRKYVGLVFKFDNTLIMDNEGLYFDTYTSPTQSEIEKFKNFEYTNTQTYELRSTVTHALQDNTKITATKNENGTWELAEGVDTRITINPVTGEIKIPTDLIRSNSGVVANSYSGTTTTYQSVQRPNNSAISMPVITFKDNFTTEIIPIEDSRVNKTELIYVHPDMDKIAVSIEKSPEGVWQLKSMRPNNEGNWIPTENIEGLTVDQATGKVTISADKINPDSTIEAIHNGVAYRAYSRTPYATEAGVKVIRPTSAITQFSEEDGVIIRPYDDGRTNRMVIDYAETATNTPTFNESGEYYGHNNWNKIEFPWIKTRLSHGNDHTIYYSSAPGANEREMYTLGYMGGVMANFRF